MNNDENNESDAGGEKVDTPVTGDKTPLTDAEKVRKETEELKAENDAYDTEKLRAKTARAEKQKDGKSPAGEGEKTQDELDEEAAKVFMQEDE